MGLTIGVDVGGTKIALGVVDESGQVLDRMREETPATDPDAVESTIAYSVAQLRTRHDVTAVGVGAAGFIDVARATVLLAPNLAWRNEPLRDDLAALIGLPVVVENDANAAAWGEFRFGAGADVDDLVLVTVGTGVGGGIVQDGALYRGAFGVAGEVGHFRVVPGGRLCGCGNRGCWEQYASGTALVRDTQEAAQSRSSEAATLLEMADGSVDQIEGTMITRAARDGDPFARRMLAETGRWLGEGIASLASILDPAVVAIGGGVSEAGELLLEPAREAFRANLTGRKYRPELEIRPATLGGDAGLLGAADLARR